MRILILGLNHAPEPISTAVYSTGMAQALASRGHEVRVIAGLPYYPGWQVFAGWPRMRYKRVRRPEGHRVTHCPLYVPARPDGRKRLLHHLSFAVTALPVALWGGLAARPDLVIAVAPSLMAAPVALLAGRLAGAATWLHVQDFEAEAAFATGLLRRESFVGRLALKTEALILRAFDRVSTISAPMCRRLRDKGVNPGRITEFRNWADLGRVLAPGDAAALKAELGLASPHVALYSGNLANKQGLEILPAAAKLLAHRDDLSLVICGEGPMRDELQRLAQGMNNIRFLPLQPVERLGTLLAMADIHLLPQIAGAADLVLPSKLANMLASGRPVIATAAPETALAREIEGCGLAVPPGDAARLAEAIAALLDAPDRRGALGQAARMRAMRRWDGMRILADFAVAAEALAAGDRGPDEAAATPGVAP